MHIPRTLLSLFLLLLVAHNAIGACTAPRLTQRPAVPISPDPMPDHYPRGMALADFNKDGVLDLASSTPAPVSQNVFVQWGNGDGTFQPPFIYQSGGEFSLRVHAADFNGDTWLDLITVNMLSYTVSVLLNRGDGTFAAPLITPTGPFRVDRAFVGDANGDGVLDVGVSGETAQLLYGNGNGTFHPSEHLELSGKAANFVFGDFNIDGRTDLAVLVQPAVNAGEPLLPSYLRLYIGNGNGSYSNSTLTLAEHSGGTLLAADLNGDGAPELITADNPHSNVSVFVNNSDGTYAARVDYPLPAAAESLALEDINEDGKRDLVIGSINATDLIALLGNGDGSFAPAPYTRRITAPAYVLHFHAVAVGDLNGDHRPDILLADSSHDVAFRLHNLCAPRWAGVQLSSSANPSAYGTSVELIANMDFRGTTRPTGTISFYEGTALVDTVTLSPTNSMASTFVVNPALGAHQYTVRYSGDATFGASSSPPHTHTVQRGPSRRRVVRTTSSATGGSARHATN